MITDSESGRKFQCNVERLRKSMEVHSHDSMSVDIDTSDYYALQWCIYICIASQPSNDVRRWSYILWTSKWKNEQDEKQKHRIIIT
jgi:hypothetical protein